MAKADMIVKEIPAPIGMYCKSGHKAKELFRRGGADSPEEPTKFFQVSGGDLIDGCYCEPCIIVANYLAEQKKKMENK